MHNKSDGMTMQRQNFEKGKGKLAMKGDGKRAKSIKRESDIFPSLTPRKINTGC